MSTVFVSSVKCRGIYLYSDVSLRQLIDSLKSAPHDWYFGRYDLAGCRRWICRNIVYSASLSDFVAQEERHQVSSSQYSTQRRFSDLIMLDTLSILCNIRTVFSVS